MKLIVEWDQGFTMFVRSCSEASMNVQAPVR